MKYFDAFLAKNIRIMESNIILLTISISILAYSFIDSIKAISSPDIDYPSQVISIAIILIVIRVIYVRYQMYKGNL